MPNKSIKEIKDKGRTIAIVFSKNIKADGVKFLTPQNYPLQIGLLEHKKGKEVPAHFHPHHKYNVKNTQEFIYMEKGSADIVIYDKAWKKKAIVKLTRGDSVLFVDCGHSVNFSKNSRAIEIKQGPYPGDKKAKIFKDN